ncbi:MAG: hypothetical protein E7223_04990 [Clostridiales bacterium]|nr:hypothetical protein [Clostridiales bacterium]
MFEVLVMAGGFLAFAMGSGFASGQEVLRFFSLYGFWGSLGGGLLAAAIFAGTGALVAADGARLKLAEPDLVYDHYLGKTLGTLYRLVMPIVMFLFLAVMSAGAGAAFQESFGLPNWAGIVAMMGLCFLTVCFDLRTLLQAIGGIGMLILGASVLLSVTVLLDAWERAGGMQQLFLETDSTVRAAEEAGAIGTKSAAGFSWWSAGILYASYNLLTAFPFLNGMGKEASGAGRAAWGGLLGGTFYMAGAMLMNLALRTDLAAVAESQLPLLFLAGQRASWTEGIFAFLLLGSIYTTAAPLLWSLTESLTLSKRPANRRFLAFFLACLAAVGGTLPFDRMLTAVYPLAGWAGLILPVSAILHHFRRRFV